MTSKKNNLKSDLFSEPTKQKIPSNSQLLSSQKPAESEGHSKPNIKLSNPLEVSPSSSRKKGPTTRIIVKYDVGFNNSIYLRGEGADLSWERGVMLKNLRADEWIWETNNLFSKCEFKVLINDRQYELGENHHLQCGTSFEYTPTFHDL